MKLGPQYARRNNHTIFPDSLTSSHTFSGWNGVLKIPTHEELATAGICQG